MPPVGHKGSGAEQPQEASPTFILLDRENKAHDQLLCPDKHPVTERARARSLYIHVASQKDLCCF